MTCSDGTISTADGTEIYYKIRGSGPDMVLVAGLGDDHKSWENQVEFFSKDYTTVVFDNRGIGRSSIPKGPYSIRQLADDAHTVVTKLGLGPVSAVGSSMGGAICQEWAINRPDDIDRLVLTNTWAERNTFTDVLFDHWIGLVEAGAGHRIMEALLLFSFSPAFLSSNQELVNEFLALDPPPVDGFLGGSHACRNHHTIDRLSQVRQPTLVVAGELDILTRPELSRRMVDALPNSEYFGLQAGHMLFWEKPDEFNRKVAEFLKGAS